MQMQAWAVEERTVIAARAAVDSARCVLIMVASASSVARGIASRSEVYHDKRWRKSAVRRRKQNFARGFPYPSCTWHSCSAPRKVRRNRGFK